MADSIALHAQPRFSGAARFPWIYAAWLRSLLLGLFVLGAMATVVAGAKFEYSIALGMMLFCTYWSLYLLADRPLLNPMQAPVFLFVLWLAAGPIATSAAAIYVGAHEQAVVFLEESIGPLWISAFGLPLYSVGVRLGVGLVPRESWISRHLAPRVQNYHIRTIALVLTVGGLAAFLTRWLSPQSSGVVEVTYLGGVQTETWWAGGLLALVLLVRVAESALMKALIDPAQESTRVHKWLAILILLVNFPIALTAGTKSAFVLTLMFLLFAYVSRNQKPPVGWMIAVTVAILVFVEPFVSFGRQVAEKAEIETAAERRELFAELARTPEDFARDSASQLNVGALFRGISSIAGAITSNSSMLEGAWPVDTFAWGLEAQLPRALFGDKPPLSIGNYIAHEGSPGILAPGDDVTNVSPAVPFEAVGNYGWIAGVLAFPVLGLLWTSAVVLLLSRARLESHPLAPLIVGMSLSFEAPLGHFLAAAKSLAVPLAALVFLSVLWRRRI